MVGLRRSQRQQHLLGQSWNPTPWLFFASSAPLWPKTWACRRNKSMGYWFGSKLLKPSNASPKPSRSPVERISFKASYSRSKLLMWVSICFKHLSMYGLEAEDHIKCLLAAMLNQWLQSLQLMVINLKLIIYQEPMNCNRQASK